MCDNQSHVVPNARCTLCGSGRVYVEWPGFRCQQCWTYFVVKPVQLTKRVQPLPEKSK